MRKTNVRRFFSNAKLKGIMFVHRLQGKQLVHLLHIGKTGGTAVKYALTQNPADSRYAVYLHPHYYRLTDVPEGEKVIFFLRDPISRFISGFYSRQRQGQPRYSNPWSKNEKIAFEEFNTPNQLALALSSTDAVKKGKAQSAMKNIHHVRDSYWNWFTNEEYFRSRVSDIFFIGFQERLSDDFEILKTKLGLPENAKLPGDDIQSHRNPQNMDKSLDDEAIENLKNWYKDDLIFIQICKNFVEQRGLDI